MIGWLILAGYLAGVVAALYPAYTWIKDEFGYRTDGPFDHGMFGMIAALLAAAWPIIAVISGTFLLSRHMWRYRLLFSDEDERETTDSRRS